ncbi:phage major tail tube protein [Haemophilus pittmaniae HK 85]|jgi:phage major tail tube protein|uniref:Phage major tail tube protein n=5 Tax=root TaxID=1 RepID=A0A369YYY2_HAEPA|nr:MULTISPECIES: phage major tail tube protein [Haemophilus]DAE14149.1 MAG TPA: tail tube protein [Myoviridae sp. ctTDl1]DAI54639.1 MAG TPA: tail tube protein [Caudoviricetes sp.]DAT20163.1 MAG TPA: tail tube protein [Bacteriophage sp.]EGV05651.1 phage major tail tube protein [Haemophilus pittmaniae HK 85]EIJ28580.1 phage major tail tube protein [Haemophilus parainfluenzae HK2019]
MALPRKLKLMNFLADGNSYRGQVTEITQPKLAMKLEEYRAGGMIGPVKVNLGVEGLEAQFKMGGYMTELIKEFGGKIDGSALRFAGAYQQDDTEEVTAIELIMRGRFSEIDNGTSKSGDDTEQSYTVPLTYYKIIENGKDLVEIDLLNSIFIVGGTDRLAEHRSAIGI